jgi:hypothetical protein
MTEIAPISASVPTIINKPRNPITTITATGNPGEYKVNQTWYEVTVYDYKGQIKEITNSYRYSYIV